MQAAAGIPGSSRQLQCDGRLVILAAGTLVLDHGTIVSPTHPAITQLIVQSGPYLGAKCWVSGSAPWSADPSPIAPFAPKVAYSLPWPASLCPATLSSSPTTRVMITSGPNSNRVANSTAPY